MKNNKGQIFSFAILLILAIIITITFFSTKFRFLIAGIGLVIMSFVVISNDKRIKNDRVRTTVFLILFGLGLVAIFSMGLLQTTISGQYVQIQAKGYYECAPSSTQSLITTSTNQVPEAGTGWIKCGSSGTTDVCNYNIQIPANSQYFVSGVRTRIVYQICDLDKGTCQNQQFVENTKDINVAVSFGHSVWVDVQAIQTINIFAQIPIGDWYNVQAGNWKYSYKPFILWKETLQGGRNPYTSTTQGCTFTSSNGRNRLLEPISGLLPDDNDGVNDLLPYQTWNFVEFTLPVSVESSDLVRGGYCRDATIYSIDEVSTASGTYDVVNFDNSIDNSPECCPSENEPDRFCNSNLRWETRDTGDDGTTNEECSLFNPCANNQFQAFDDKELRKFSCENNLCVAEFKNVECAYTSDCGVNEVCDITSWTCEEVDLGEGADNTHMGGEATESSCKFFETFKTSEEKQYKIWNYFGIGTPETVPVEKCVLAGWVYFAGIFVVVIIFGLTIIFINKPKRRRRR